MQYARNPQALDQLSLFQNAWMASRARMASLDKPAPVAPRQVSAKSLSTARHASACSGWRQYCAN